MTRMTLLLERNEQFARGYTPVPLGPPTAQLLLVTCLDHRVDPAIVLGLRLGDAPIIRNAGGRVTRAVIDDIAYLAFLGRRCSVCLTGFSRWLSSTTHNAERAFSPTLSFCVKPLEATGISEAALGPPRSPTHRPP